MVVIYDSSIHQVKEDFFFKLFSCLILLLEFKPTACDFTEELQNLWVTVCAGVQEVCNIRLLLVSFRSSFKKETKLYIA